MESGGDEAGCGIHSCTFLHTLGRLSVRPGCFPRCLCAPRHVLFLCACLIPERYACVHKCSCTWCVQARVCSWMDITLALCSRGKYRLSPVLISLRYKYTVVMLYAHLFRGGGHFGGSKSPLTLG